MPAMTGMAATRFGVDSAGKSPSRGIGSNVVCTLRQSPLSNKIRGTSEGIVPSHVRKEREMLELIVIIILFGWFIGGLIGNAISPFDDERIKRIEIITILVALAFAPWINQMCTAQSDRWLHEATAQAAALQGEWTVKRIDVFRGRTSVSVRYCIENDKGTRETVDNGPETFEKIAVGDHIRITAIKSDSGMFQNHLKAEVIGK